MKPIRIDGYEVFQTVFDYTQEQSLEDVLKQARSDLEIYKSAGWELDHDDLGSIRFDALVSGQVYPTERKFFVTFLRKPKS